MTATDIPPAPVIDFTPIMRVTDGEPHESELMVEYHAPYMVLPAWIVIAEGWVTDRETGVQRFEAWDQYDLTELPGERGGRVFRLGREERKILFCEPGGDRRAAYTVLVARSLGMCDCDCRGHRAMNGLGMRQTCKHLATVFHFVEKGVI